MREQNKQGKKKKITRTGVSHIDKDNNNLSESDPKLNYAEKMPQKYDKLITTFRLSSSRHSISLRLKLFQRKIAPFLGESKKTK